MTDLMRYAAQLDGLGADRRPPPVEQWSPDYCGELDLTIKANGAWVHEGTPIGRARLVRLFSTIIRKDGDRFFLVTPVEKLGIEVEDAPFTAVLVRQEGTGAARRLVFTTNVGEELAAGPDNAIEMRTSPVFGPQTPYIHVRRNLWALIARAVFYDLAELGVWGGASGETGIFGVWSSGVFFPLADQLAGE